MKKKILIDKKSHKKRLNLLIFKKKNNVKDNEKLCLIYFLSYIQQFKKIDENLYL